MKVTRIITKEVELDVNLEITEATLLTAEEAEKLPERLKRYNDWWWLKSPGYTSHLTTLVGGDGFVDYFDYVCYSNNKVRPALIISNLESTGFQIGDTFEFGGKEFEVISDDRAFCLSDIGYSAFRKDWEASNANVYEKSDIKKYVDNWFKKVKETKE